MLFNFCTITCIVGYIFPGKDHRSLFFSLFKWCLFMVCVNQSRRWMQPFIWLRQHFFKGVILGERLKGETTCFYPCQTASVCLNCQVKISILLRCIDFLFYTKWILSWQIYFYRLTDFLTMPHFLYLARVEG